MKNDIPRELLAISMSDPVVAAVLHAYLQDPHMSLVDCLTRLAVAQAETNNVLQRRLEQALMHSPRPIVRID